MHSYVVVVDHEARKGDWALRDRELQPRDWLVSYPDFLAKNNPDSFNIERPVGMQVSFCNDEAHANAHAQFMAKLHPNREVYVAKVCMMAIAKVNAPTVLSVTEKGVLPK